MSYMYPSDSRPGGHLGLLVGRVRLLVLLLAPASARARTGPRRRGARGAESRSWPALEYQPAMGGLDGKAVVLGLDGVTWDLLDPLCQAGVMPNLARARQSGRSGLSGVVPAALLRARLDVHRHRQEPRPARHLRLLGGRLGGRAAARLGPLGARRRTVGRGLRGRPPGARGQRAGDLSAGPGQRQLRVGHDDAGRVGRLHPPATAQGRAEGAAREATRPTRTPPG